MQHNYSSESETSGMSENLLVLRQLAWGGCGKREEQMLCNKLHVGLVKSFLEIKDTNSI